MGNSDWGYFALGELTDNLDSVRVPVKESERKKGQYPYYGASGVIDMVDGYLFNGEYLLVAEDGENLRSRKTPIAFMAKGKFWVNNHAHIVQGNSKSDTRFLMYALHSTDISGYLTGSTIPKLTQDNLNRIPIYAPTLPEQRAIAGILGALDDKIEVNRRMNVALEAMARAVFRQWFVKNIDIDTWEVKTLGDVLAVLETGSRPKGGVTQEPVGLPSVGAESIVKIGFFDFSKTKFVSNEFYESMRRGHVEDRDILLYKDGGRPGEFEPHVSMFGDGFPFKNFSINEHVYRIRVAPPLSQAYFYFWLESDEIMEEMRNRGTGVAIPGLNSTALSGISISIPPKELLNKFSNYVEPLISKIFANAKESRTLASLRDSLLPKLMRGEVRVKE
jgi:type I restriction enzyme, S subunit